MLCLRKAMDRINWSNADASNLVEKLLHNMKRLGRGKGFAAVNGSLLDDCCPSQPDSLIIGGRTAPTRPFALERRIMTLAASG